MFDRSVRLTGPAPEYPAGVPPTRKAWVEHQRAVDQRHHGADVLAEKSQHEGGICEHTWVVAGDLKDPPSKIGALQAVCLRVFAPAVLNETIPAKRGPCERRPVTWIARDRLLHKTERLMGLLYRRRNH